MAIFLNGLYINSEQRFKDGKQDGYNMLVAVGSEAHKVKISDGVYNGCAVGALKLGDSVSCEVKVRAFRDTVYYTAQNVQVVTEG